MKLKVTYEIQPQQKFITEEVEVDKIHLDKLVEIFDQKHPDIAKTSKVKVYLIEYE